jgi:hypothetical protein
MPAVVQRLNTVIVPLVDEIRRYAHRRGQASRAPVPGPPATEEDIAMLERRIGRRLPPTYRAFLELHDGFANLAFPGNILRLSDRRPKATVTREHDHDGVVDHRRLVTQYDDGEAPVEAVIIADYSEPNHWAYLDPGAPSGDDEWSIVFYDPSDDDRMYPDLVAFLESCLDQVRGFHKAIDAGRLRGRP